jgi:16S rRNA (cytidine1402-2'-O)-methyltransferase
MNAGRLHLVAVPIAAAPAGTRTAFDAATVAAALPPPALALLRATHYFLVEEARSARAFLKAAGHPGPIAELRIVEIGHAPDPAALDGWLAPLQAQAGRTAIDAVVLSEAGCPGIADPGATLVARAHELGLAVQPWVGPSALLLALMGAGLNGQQFRFHGYLPQEREALRARLGQLQADAQRGETQLFIETPYRNERLFEALLQQLDPALRLCVAVDLTGAQQQLQTRRIGAWRGLPAAQRPRLDRLPAVFLVQGDAAARP